MFLKEKKDILKQIKEINILTKPKKSTFIGKTQKLLIPEQIFNLKNNTIIISGYMTIEREYNQKCNCKVQIFNIKTVNFIPLDWSAEGRSH